MYTKGCVGDYQRGYGISSVLKQSLYINSKSSFCHLESTKPSFWSRESPGCRVMFQEKGRQKLFGIHFPLKGSSSAWIFTPWRPVTPWWQTKKKSKPNRLPQVAPRSDVPPLLRRDPTFWVLPGSPGRKTRQPQTNMAPMENHRIFGDTSSKPWLFFHCHLTMLVFRGFLGTNEVPGCDRDLFVGGWKRDPNSKAVGDGFPRSRLESPGSRCCYKGWIFVGCVWRFCVFF